MAHFHDDDRHERRAAHADEQWQVVTGFVQAIGAMHKPLQGMFPSAEASFFEFLDQYFAEEASALQRAHGHARCDLLKASSPSLSCPHANRSTL